MKTKTTNNTESGSRRRTNLPQFARNLALAGAFAFTAISVPQALADDEYEWDSTWGLHEEEWYDPSDWFNEDGQIDYEGVGTYTYDDDYYYDDVWNSYGYYGDYGYEYTGYDPVTTGYDYYYQWSPVDNDWTETKGDEAASDQKSAEAQEMSKDKKKKSIDKKDVLTMRGTITSVGMAKAKGGDKDHTFVMLEASEGKSVLVDFGPKAKVGKIELKKGNKIQVRGPRTKLGGKYVLVAQQISRVDADSE
jgi:hypothetical protein